MLVLQRKRGETIVIGDNVTVTVLSVQGDRVKLGFSGPPEVAIHRSEVQEAIRREHHALVGCP
jgi:carbon storage regulator